MTQSVRISLIALALAFCVQQAGAQYGQPPRNLNLNDLRDVDVEGTVEGVKGTILQVKASAGHPYLIALRPGFSKLGITGTAKPDFLKPGKSLVSFTVEFPKDSGKKVEVAEPLKEMAIVTPSETNTIGIFNEDRDNQESTKWFVRAPVRSYRDGKLTVAAGGKEIIVPVPADLDIKLDSADLSIVRPGDSIKVAGKQVQAYKSEGNNIQPGQVVGQTVDIKLQETLSAATFKKKPGGR